MSLNKLTISSDYLEKQYLNIGCNDIKCTSLEIKGQSIKPQQPVDIDGGAFNPTLTANDCTLGQYQAFFRYNNNLMTVYINVDFTISVATTAIVTLQCPLPTGYTILTDIQQYPTSGSMSNNVATPFTSGDGFTSVSGNSVSCDFRQNGANFTTGQIGKISFIGTFQVNPPPS
jgi:hypothetical protein